MNSLFIPVKITAGTHIEKACKDMRELSDQLHINLEASFNGIQLLAFYGTNQTAQEIEKAYDRDSYYNYQIKT